MVRRRHNSRVHGIGAISLRLGGAIELNRDEEGALLTLAVPHDRLDVFGLCFLISHFGGNFEPLATRAGNAPVRRRMGDAVSAHRSTPTPVELQRDGTTFTQRVLRHLLPTLKQRAVTHVSLVVAQHDPVELDHRAFEGNGFMLVDFEVDALLALASLPSNEWGDEMRRRAERVARIAERKTSRLLQSRSQVMISAGGTFDRLPWAARVISPEFLQAIATPWRPETFNIYCWSRGGRQALSMSGRPEHSIWEAELDLFASWGRTFQ